MSQTRFLQCRLQKQIYYCHVLFNFFFTYFYSSFCYTDVKIETVGSGSSCLTLTFSSWFFNSSSCEIHFNSWLSCKMCKCFSTCTIILDPQCFAADLWQKSVLNINESGVFRMWTEELQNQGVQEVFVFCTRGELYKYRVPSLLDTYQQRGFTVHHMPFPDGDAPELEQCCQILEELQLSLENNRRTVIQWVSPSPSSGADSNTGESRESGVKKITKIEDSFLNLRKKGKNNLL